MALDSVRNYGCVERAIIALFNVAGSPSAAALGSISLVSDRPAPRGRAHSPHTHGDFGALLLFDLGADRRHVQRENLRQ